MSLATWKKAFYPVGASDKAASGTRLAAAKHSLRKWFGLRSANLAKHDVVRHGYRLTTPDNLDGGEPITIGTHCALCQYAKAKAHSESDKCSHCPLYKVRGKVACDCSRDDEDRSPFAMLIHENNPEPMIQWLRKTVASLEKPRKK